MESQTGNSTEKDIKKTKGLSNYIQTAGYRKGLCLPDNVQEEYSLLGQGEYNRNYLFTHPVTGQKLVLRINFGSQMHLAHQIEYEYNALKLLEESGRTPRPFYVDGSLKDFTNGVMVMEYLPGHALDYHTELFRAAGCLADIHSVSLPKCTHLIVPENPVRAILEECEQMVCTYMESNLADADKKQKIRLLLDLAWKQADALAAASYQCCINTELNSTNFLMNGTEGPDYLIDWEKPICGEPAQDLGHFLAPTTTFWKTDVILDEMEMRAFVEKYIEEVNGRFPVDDLWERTNTYMTVTCLRGITWCAMAWVEYQQPGRKLVNESTWRKLEAYLTDEFLGKMKRFIEK